MCFKQVLTKLGQINYVKNWYQQSYIILNQFNPSIHELYKLNKYYYQYKKKIYNKEILKTTENNGYIKMQIFKNNILDCYLIFWEPYSKSPIHNHSNNGCNLKVLNGSLEETLYNLNTDGELKLKKTSIIDKNNIGFIHNNMGVHSITNPNNYLVTSLHIYSPPDFNAKIFNENTEKT